MNQLDALKIIRSVAAASGSNTLQTRQGAAALKVIDRKIQSLERKKAWRECRHGEMPAHMTDPAHPLNAGRKFEAPLPPLTILPVWSEEEAKRDQERN